MTTQLVTALGPDAPDDGPTGRQQRGLAIAALVPIQRHKLGYKIASQSGNGSYIVNIDDDTDLVCSCPDFELRQQPCKHIFAAQLAARREEGGTETVIRSDKEDKKETNTENEKKTDKVKEVTKQPMRPTYPQEWPTYDLAQEHEEELFGDWFYDLCSAIQQPEYGFGRPRLSVADMLYCIGLKVFSGMSRRRTMTAVRRAHKEGLISSVPSNASITRYMENGALTPILKWLVQQSARPLVSVESQFAIDSTGFATRIYDRWFDAKYGKQRKSAQWVKCHLICGVKTNIVSAVEASHGTAGDSPFLPGLLTTTVQHFPAEELSADKAYLSVANIEFSEEIGVNLRVPFKENSVAYNPKARRSEAWERAFHYYQLHRAEFLQRYHLRSNVESTMWSIKAKFGTSVRSKTQVAQFNEVLFKCLCHNVCCLVKSMYQLGIEVDFRSLLQQDTEGEDRGLALAA